MEIIHYHFDNISSTNDWAKAHLQEFERGKITLVTSEAQTGGRGRYGRSWASPEKLNLYASFCFFMEEDKAEPLVLTKILALSTAKTLKECGVLAELKWPNDLLVNGKKIAGILCETALEGVVIGIGLNVNMPEELLKSVGQPATSLLLETGKLWDVGEVLESIKKHFVSDLKL